jgi:hypothetical protein
MGREIKRVPLDFDHPLKQVWPGYLMPDAFDEDSCPDRKNGYSPHAQDLHDLWYGYLPFDPASTGSTMLTSTTPAVRERAERNVASAPEFYGVGEWAIEREARRLADLFNGSWSHHLAQADVDALVAGGRLMEFTHTWSPETRWRKIDPPVTPSAEQVNEWSLRSFGHDSINAHVAVAARCDREGFPERCATCQGHGSIETHPGQRAAAEAWERSEPPTGEGWQLWETVSEGSPVSPVFADADGLAVWMSDPERGDRWVPQDVAAKFIADGWAPTLVATPQTGVVSGVEFAGWHGGGEVDES